MGENIKKDLWLIFEKKGFDHFIDEQREWTTQHWLILFFSEMS